MTAMDLALSVPGVDLSEWDDARGAYPLNFDTLIGSGVRWVILRVADAGHVDASFPRYAAALSGRLPLGTYLYAHPSREPTRQVQQWALGIARAMGDGATFPLGHWVDLEAKEGTPAERTAWLAEFLATADQSLLGRVGIYTGLGWWAGIDPDFDPGDRLWWVPRYPWQTQDGSAVGARPPDDPAQWPQFAVNRRGAALIPLAPHGAATAIWQWTSIGSGVDVGAYRPAALDCNLMDAAVFAALTAPPAVTDAATDTPAPHAPHPATPTVPYQEDDNMARLVQVQGQPEVWIIDGLSRRYVADIDDDLNPLVALGLVPPVARRPDGSLDIAAVSPTFLSRLDLIGPPPEPGDDP